MVAKLLRAVPSTVYENMFDRQEHHLQVHFRGQECYLVPNAECAAFAEKFNIYHIYQDSVSRERGGGGVRGTGVGASFRHGAQWCCRKPHALHCEAVCMFGAAEWAARG